MIIDAKTIILSLLGIVAFLYVGLQLIRQFALQIAQENHSALQAMDATAEESRIRKERAADQAAQAAFARVQPILTSPAGAAAAASTAVKEEEEDRGLV
jgi:hypothetical protein